MVKKSTKQTKPSPRTTRRAPKPQRAERKRGLSPMQRYTMGLTLMTIALILGFVVIFYYVHWFEDLNITKTLTWSSVFDGSDVALANPLGKLGALTGYYMVAIWFGAAAIIIPIILMLFSLKVLKAQLAVVNHTFRNTTILVLMVAMLSITLGFAFGTKWDMFGTGLGGEYGIFIGGYLRSVHGVLGTSIALGLLWVIFAIYINSNTITLINRVGKGVVDGTKKIGSTGSSLVGHSDRENNPPCPFKEDDEENDTIDIYDKIHTPFNEADDYIPSAPDAPLPDIATIPAGQDIKLDKDLVVNTTIIDKQVDDDQIDNSLYDPTRELSDYQCPPVELLEDYKNNVVVSSEEILDNKNRIKETLENFGIKIERTKATVGPTVTLYEIVPAAGVRISRIKSLENDIALSLSALGIRIIAPIPGKGTIGIEVPNKNPQIVSMYSAIKSVKFQESPYDIPLVLGRTIQNENLVIDLAKMPHLLVAGATGQGKSVGLNAIITSILYKKHPSELKFVMIDPKRVELPLYAKLERHFIAKLPDEKDSIITDTHKVVQTLNSLCKEMDSRYGLLNIAEVRNIKEYNAKFVRRRLNPNNGHRYMPYIVVVIDEFADLIMTAGREVETPLARLAQLGRAAGIHLIIATQRPTTNIITGTIKANFPARIAFRVSSMIDSRTIIDQPGANQLIGRGDMLVSTGSDLYRIQCAFADTPEIERITEFIANQRGYTSAYELPEPDTDEDNGHGTPTDAPTDPIFKDVAYFVVQNRQGSTSAIQRRFSIGYTRAGRLTDQLESAGIVGRADGSKAREVLVNDIETLNQILNGLGIK